MQELIVDVHINSNYPLALSFPFHPTATIQCKFIIAAHVLLFWLDTFPTQQIFRVKLFRVVLCDNSDKSLFEVSNFRFNTILNICLIVLANDKMKHCDYIKEAQS